MQLPHFYQFVYVVQLAILQNLRLFIVIRGPGDDYQDYVAMQIIEYFNRKRLDAVLVDRDEKQQQETVEGMLREVETRYIWNYMHIIINDSNERFMDYNRFHKLGMAAGFECFTLDLFNDNVQRTPHDHHQLDRTFFDAPDPPAFN